MTEIQYYTHVSIGKGGAGFANGNKNLEAITGHHTPQKFSRPAGPLEERKRSRMGAMLTQLRLGFWLIFSHREKMWLKWDSGWPNNGKSEVFMSTYSQSSASTTMSGIKLLAPQVEPHSEPLGISLTVNIDT